MTTDTIEEAVELAIKGGATVIQLREKDCSGREFLEIARSVKEVTDAYEIPLIVNDRIDIALAVDADGVHLGQKDIPAMTARELLGQDKIIGVSASNAELALQAQKDGADYIGVGDVFGTSTKADTHHVSIEELVKIRNTDGGHRRCEPRKRGKTPGNRCGWCGCDLRGDRSKGYHRGSRADGG